MHDVLGAVGVPARVTSIGAYLPDRIVTNHDLESMLDTSDVWIQKKTGIRQRHIAAEGEMASDMAAQAIMDACGRAEIAASDLDMVILGTWTSDHLNPPTSAAVLGKLGISVPAFDVHSGGCAGGVLALDVGARYAANAPDAKVAVVLSEVNSKMLDWTDRSTAVFLGDGAGCYIVESGEIGLVRTKSVVLPDYYEYAWVPAGGRAGPAHDSPTSRFFQMNGRGLWDVLHALLPEFIEEFLGPGFDRTAVDLVVMHQANLRLVESLMAACGFGMEKAVTTVEDYGNTAGASVPLTLHRALETGRLHRGDCVLMVAFGAGLTVAASLWTW